MDKKKSGKGTKTTTRKSIGKAQSRSAIAKSGAGQKQFKKSLFPIIGIGASAGGLEAFTHLIEHLPANTGMAFVLVQHLAPKHESLLSEILSRATKMRVSEVKDGIRVEPDNIYVIPPNTNMAITGGKLKLMSRTKTIGHHLPVDYFLSSLAEECTNRAIGVILSGTASDGVLGLKKIKAEGGITFAQDPTSAKYEGMPRSAIAAGVVDFILPPEKIAIELAMIGRHPFVNNKKATKSTELPVNDDDLSHLFSLLHIATGIDFTYYKHTTIKRRIGRRMVLHKIEQLKDYINYLQNNPDEVYALYKDILINVTSFFRNPELCEVLKSKVFPGMMKNRSPDSPIRIWVPGCASGEEAVSIAICLLEFLENRPTNPQIQIFATDLSKDSIERARVGIYPKSIVSDISPARLQRFFVKVNGDYQISKTIRDICVFATHNLTRDPPFSHLDLISCCNVLIYLNQALQKQVLQIFHYALKPAGLLMLGNSETVGTFSNLFAPLDKKQKIYSRKAVPVRLHLDLTSNYGLEKAEIGKQTGRIKGDVGSLLEAQKEADRILLTKYVPASFIINDDLEILQFRGYTTPYIEPATGAASLNLLKIAHPDLRFELRSAIQRARKGNVSIKKEGVEIKYNGQFRQVTIEVLPIKLPVTSSKECYFLILLEDITQQDKPESNETSRAKRGKGKQKLEDRRLAQLRQELAASKEYLQSIMEEMDATNEGIRTANEEVLSSNEEFQSTNEELETAKEELQSANEELTTLNEELQNRNLELNLFNNDLTNLLSSVQIPIVMLDNNLNIRRFTPMAEKMLNMHPIDIGRPINDLKLNIDIPDLQPLLLEVIETVSRKEREIQDREGRWYSMYLRPYKTAENLIDGAVMVLFDIDPIKRSMEEIKEARQYAEAIIDTVREPLLILNSSLRVRAVNGSFYQTFKVSPQETENNFIYDLGNGQWNIPRLRILLEEIIPEEKEFRDFEVEHDFPNIGQKIMLLNAREIIQKSNRSRLILLSIEDITERREVERKLNASEIRFRRLFETAQDGILILDPDTQKITDVNPFMIQSLDYSHAELLGKELWEIGLFKDKSSYQDAFLELQRNGFIRYEDLPLKTKGGEHRKVEIIGNLYSEGGHSVIQCNIRDVTRRKEVEEERSRLLTHEKDARTEAETANRSKDEFLATVSHELRTPLTAMLGWARLLREGKLDEAAFQRGIETIVRNSRTQMRLIEDLLDISRIISGKLSLDLQQLDPAPIIMAAIDSIRPEANARKLQLVSLFDPSAGMTMADPVRLQQVVWNLLSNAVKFTPEGGLIEVRLERIDSRIKLTVSDTGNGISPEFLPYIFDRFRQADSTSKRLHGGLGLGLAIVHHIVELHGGTIRAESEGEGQGATFTVELPLIDVPLEASDSRQMRESGEHMVLPDNYLVLEGLQVLVVDDETDMLEVVTIVLEQRGADVIAVTTVAEALEVLKQKRPDVLISDIAMPYEDGYTLISKVRALKREEGGRIPAAALTAYAKFEDQVRALSAGFQRFVSKPVEPEELILVVANLARKRPQNHKGTKKK